MRRSARTSCLPQTHPESLKSSAIFIINLLIARFPTKELQTAQEMETFGFLLMDTLVYYSFDLKKRTIPDDTIRAHAGQGQDPLLLGKCNRAQGTEHPRLPCCTELRESGP